jgi:hypothetical protein
MNTEHDKLIAKIQFYYDFLCTKHDNAVYEVFENDEDASKISTRIHSLLAEEYRRIFEEILYME